MKSLASKGYLILLIMKSLKSDRIYGGQLPNKLSKLLYQSDFEILGHSYQTIDMAENR